MKQKIEMAWEWNWPEWCLWHNFPLFNCEVTVGVKGDHTPGVHVLLIIAGLKLLDFGYYNTYHADDYEEFVDDLK